MCKVLNKHHLLKTLILYYMCVHVACSANCRSCNGLLTCFTCREGYFVDINGTCGGNDDISLHYNQILK